MSLSEKLHKEEPGFFFLKDQMFGSTSNDTIIISLKQ